MQVLSPEFIVLCVLLLLSKRLKQKLPKLESLLKGLIVYLPPSNEQIQEAKKTPDRFKLSCLLVDKEFSEASPFFSESEILTALAAITSGVLVANWLGETCGLFSTDYTLSFYLCLLVVVFSISGAYQQVFQSGISNPDNLIGFMFSLTLFFLGALILNFDHHKLLDFNFHLSLRMLNLTFTSALVQFWNFSFELDYLTFSVACSFLAALCLFPFFKFVFRSTLNFYSTIKTPFDVEGAEANSKIMPLVLVSPLLLVILWVKPMAKDPLVGLMGEKYFEAFRMGVVLLVVAFRTYHIRTEVQALLNQAKHLIYSMIIDSSKSNVETSTLQCKAIATYAWPLAHQSLASIFLLGFLVFIYLTKAGISVPYPQPVTETVVTEGPVEKFDEDEFVFVQESPKFGVVTPSRQIEYYKEVTLLENQITQTKSNLPNQEKLSQKILEFSKLKLVPDVFYRDLVGFFLFLYSIFTSLSIILSLLYTRRFPGKSKIT